MQTQIRGRSTPNPPLRLNTYFKKEKTKCRFFFSNFLFNLLIYLSSLFRLSIEIVAWLLGNDFSGFVNNESNRLLGH